MYLISAEGYQNKNVGFLKIKTTSEDIWVNMKDVGSGVGVNKYKMTKREIYKKFNNLSNEELNAKNNKKTYVRNDVMTTIIKWCRGEKTRGIRAIDGFRNKLMIPDSEISKCPEFEVKPKIGKIFKNIIPLKKILLRFMKLILIFMNTMKKNTSW